MEAEARVYNYKDLALNYRNMYLFTKFISEYYPSVMKLGKIYKNKNIRLKQYTYQELSKMKTLYEKSMNTAKLSKYYGDTGREEVYLRLVRILNNGDTNT